MLYDGDTRYERDYITKFAASKGAVIIGAYEGVQMVGAATGAPLKDHFDDFAAPLVAAGYRAEDLFYFGESVLLEAFRGRGIGVDFFIEREKAALEAGFDRVVFCSVIRPRDHPMRPQDHLAPPWLSADAGGDRSISLERYWQSGRDIQADAVLDERNYKLKRF